MKNELKAAVRVINAEIARLTQIRDGLVQSIGEGAQSPVSVGRSKKKRVVSEATKAKMRASWAKRKKAQAAGKKA